MMAHWKWQKKSQYIPEPLFLESLEAADPERFKIPGVEARELSLSDKPSPSNSRGLGVSSLSNKVEKF